MENTNRTIAYMSKREPALDMGKYMLQSLQSVEVKEGNRIRGEDQLDEKYEFTVSYQRFRLSPAEIHSAYPPAFTSGDYTNHIPQLTLMEETLPWETSLFVKKSGENLKVPGMFLLMLEKEEGVKKHYLSPAEWTPREPYLVYIGKELLRYCQEYKGETQECCIDVSAALLKDILPQPEDLPYMAHIRWVKVEDKETRQFISEGHYSSLIANRVPTEERLSQAGEQSICYEVFVVPTVGLYEYYQGLEPDFSGRSTVRLSCLYSWEFTCEAAKNSSGVFQSVIQALDCGYMGNETYHGIDESLQQMLGMGYRPFNTYLRDGAKTAAWYKTPLSPVKMTLLDRRESSYGHCLSHADEGMAFLPELGMYDATYSAAWTLGRLLAFKNEPYLTALFELRLKNHAREKEEWNINLIRDLIYEESGQGDGERDNNGLAEISETICKKLNTYAAVKGQGGKK